MNSKRLRLLFAVSVIFMAMIYTAQAQTTNINGVKINQLMGDFHKTAKYRFTERSYM